MFTYNISVHNFFFNMRLMLRNCQRIWIVLAAALNKITLVHKTGNKLWKMRENAGEKVIAPE